MNPIHDYRSRTTGGKSGWRSVALTIFAVAVLVATVNVMAWEYLQAYPVNRGLSRVWQKWQLLELQTDPVDWLILGDSTCGQGIMPSVIEAETGESALNLCTIANAIAVNGAWQLQRYIDKVGPPKRAVFFHAFHVWERPPDDLVSMLNQIPLEDRFYNQLEPSLNLGVVDQVEIATRPLRTLYDSNLSIQYILSRELRALVGGEVVDRSEAYSDLGFIIRHKGYVPSNQALPERVAAQSKFTADTYAQRSFFIAPENEASLRALCAISEEHGFPIYLANSSIARMLYEDEKFKKYYSSMVRSLSAILEPCKSVAYVMKVPAQFEPEEMDNVDHVVTDDVARRLTLELIQAVRDAEE